ncbi:MAG: hypothetical protein FJ296_03205, partial [Planctomycetes bacterium]|nr:hypothetical protein [Planctomycetota bacterium]
MTLARLLRVAAVALAVCLPCASAQEQEVLETQSGAKYAGKILSDDGKAVEIEMAGGATMKLNYPVLTPRSVYRLQVLRTGPTAHDQLALAEWCIPMKLYEEARVHYRKAIALDPDMKLDEAVNASVAKARTAAANELLERGKGLQASSQKQEARRVLSLLVQELPEEPAAQEAATLLASETTQRKQDALSRKLAKLPEPGPDAPRRADGEPFSDETRLLFLPVIEAYHKMLDATHDGLVKGGSGGIKELEQALREGEKIRKEADKIKAKEANSAEVAEALVLVDEKLEEAVVDARINIVDNYLLRNSYNQAGDVVREGLASYPQNPRLRQAMDRVTAA